MELQISKQEQMRRKAAMKLFFWVLFYVHLALYVWINVILIAVNLVESPEKLWFYWPLFGWGFWVFLHFLFNFVMISNTARRWREAQIKKIIAEGKK